MAFFMGGIRLRKEQSFVGLLIIIEQTQNLFIFAANFVAFVGPAERWPANS